MKKIGLVLSGGGARGMAHVGVLKVIDELGIKIDAIAGCSIGAVIGTMYAAGKTADDIEGFALTHSIYKNFNLSLNTLGISNISKLEKLIKDFTGVENFGQLQIPLYINSTNLNTGKEVVFSRGRLSTAIRASIAVPGIFSPAKINDENYIDGGVLNEVPFSILPDDINRYIIIDVSPFKPADNKKRFNIIDVLSTSVKIMQKQITTEKIKALPSDRYTLISPDVYQYKLLETEKKFKEILYLGEIAAQNKKKDLISL